jgi:hypothetical protein
MRETIHVVRKFHSTDLPEAGIVATKSEGHSLSPIYLQKKVEVD